MGHINGDYSLGPNASRLLATEGQYPPTDFAAYGILAFRSLATSDSQQRYVNICQGFVASLPQSSELQAAGIPQQHQMVTIWPVDNVEIVEAIEVLPAGEQANKCPDVVRSINLRMSLLAIQHAKESAKPIAVGLEGAIPEGSELAQEKIKSVTQRRGPFLIAWSPAEKTGEPGAPFLLVDLSDVTTVSQATTIFQDWRTQIESNPDIWVYVSGWDLELLRDTLRLWADRYGTGILELIGVSE